MIELLIFAAAGAALVAAELLHRLAVRRQRKEFGRRVLAWKLLGKQIAAADDRAIFFRHFPRPLSKSARRLYHDLFGDDE